MRLAHAYDLQHQSLIPRALSPKPVYRPESGCAPRANWLIDGDGKTLKIEVAVQEQDRSSLRGRLRPPSFTSTVGIDSESKYLEQEYLPEHNRRFARQPAQAGDYHGRKPMVRELQEIFRLETKRTISNDWGSDMRAAGCNNIPASAATGRRRAKPWFVNGNQNDPGVLPGRKNRIFGNEGADAESGCTASASDPREGDEAASQPAVLAAGLSNHEAVAGGPDARRAARGNAPLRFALKQGSAPRRIPTNNVKPKKGTLLMGTFLTSFDTEFSDLDY